MAKFLKVGVSKKMNTDLYIEVPDNFTTGQFRFNYQSEVNRIADATAGQFDWEPDEDVLIESVKFISEQEAAEYRCGKLDPAKNDGGLTYAERRLKKDDKPKIVGPIEPIELF